MKYKEFGKSPNERAPKSEDSESLACTLEATLNYDAQSFINGVVWARRNLKPAPPLIRYCPECGHVGPLPDDVPACCPDSHHAYVPETFVEVLQRANGVVDRMFDELAKELRHMVDAYEGYINSEYEGCDALSDKLAVLEPARKLLARMSK